MLETVVDAVAEYVNREDTRKVLEQRILKPCIDYVQDKTWWAVRVFQGMAVLVVLQTVLLLAFTIFAARVYFFKSR